MIFISGSGSSQKFERGLLDTTYGKEMTKLLINDIELEARESTNRGTIHC